MGAVEGTDPIQTCTVCIGMRAHHKLFIHQVQNAMTGRGRNTMAKCLKCGAEVASPRVYASKDV